MGNVHELFTAPVQQGYKGNNSLVLDKTTAEK